MGSYPSLGLAQGAAGLISPRSLEAYALLDAEQYADTVALAELQM